MQLTCPNCGARYEIDDDLIPETGRDVQCSNCAHTWFQLYVPSTPAGAHQKPELSQAVLSILREEAEREQRARAGAAPEAAEGAGAWGASAEGLAPTDGSPAPAQQPVQGRAAPETAPETATETAPETATETAPELAPAMAPETAPEPGPAAPQAPAGGAPRPVRAGGGAETRDAALAAHTLREPDEGERGGSGGFLGGFVGIILVGAMGAGLYLGAPGLSEWMPALSPALSAYVNAIDGALAALNGVLRAVMPASSGG